MNTETDAQKLQRMARESLPRLAGPDSQKGELCPECGEYLPAEPKIRNRRRVCNDCAAAIPRLPGGKRPGHVCAGCGDIVTRAQMKMKDRKLYCKKCLKKKFMIDF